MYKLVHVFYNIKHFFFRRIFEDKCPQCIASITESMNIISTFQFCYTIYQIVFAKFSSNDISLNRPVCLLCNIYN